jgi:hypothetical protein
MCTTVVVRRGPLLTDLFAQDDAAFAKGLIKTLALDTQGIVDIIEHLSNGLKGVEEDRVKRSRTDNLVGTEQCAIALMHFLESQDLETVSAAPILVSTGLQSLSDILDKQASLNTSVADYLQQALLSMMTSAVARIEVRYPGRRRRVLLLNRFL